MKELTKTLQEKYLNETKNEKAKLSRFLKRRRIELGKTLEEVSEGVCSTSYLSKIENCLVDVDDSYFKMLFEKLNLEYNNVVNERSAPIYDEMIKAYLLEDYKYIEELTNTVERITRENASLQRQLAVLQPLSNVDEFTRTVLLEKVAEIVCGSTTAEVKEFIDYLDIFAKYKKFGSHK